MFRAIDVDVDADVDVELAPHLRKELIKLLEYSAPPVKSVGRLSTPNLAWMRLKRPRTKAHKSTHARTLRWRVTVFFSEASHLRCFFLIILFSGGWGKLKLKLTTLPRIFIHVMCRFNSIAFAIKLYMSHPKTHLVNMKRSTLLTIQLRPGYTTKLAAKQE